MNVLQPFKSLSRSVKSAFGAKHIQVRNAYEAGATGRRLGIWRPSSLGPNAAVLRDLPTLRDRSRNEVRNNAWIAQGVRNYVSNEIGCGISPIPLSPDKAFNEAAKQLWQRWSKTCDADGALSFDGLLAQASRARVEAGEVFVRLRLRSRSFGLPVPLQLQLLEPEFCPVEHNDFSTGAGRTVRAGIEFNGIGQRRAYWMHTSHPADMFATARSVDLVPVPADGVIHHFAPLRPGQIRGVPWTVQALIKAKIFDEYDDSELIRKRDKSSYSGFIAQKNFPTEAADGEGWLFNPITGEPLKRDQNGVPIMNVEAGQFIVGYPGEEPVLFEGDNTGSGYADFVRQQLLGAAAALGIPYEFLTGDLSKINDRTARILMNEYHRIIMQSQWHLVIPQICVRVWEEFVDLAVLTGALDAPGYETKRDAFLAADWRTDRWDYIHPEQDVRAELMAIGGGLKSRTQAVAERGESAEDVDKQNAEDKGRAEGFGLEYDFGGKAQATGNDQERAAQ